MRVCVSSGSHFSPLMGCLFAKEKGSKHTYPPTPLTETHTHKQEGLSPNVIELERARVKRDHPPSAES